MSNYIYNGEKGELSPEECKEYFLESPLRDWVRGDEDHWGCKEHPSVRVDSDENGKQVLLYNDCPIAMVVITEGARGIWKYISVDIVSTLKETDE
tara:strand:- start:82 stop:366 length:285 start_codon:yes stop_codon:yes gene_type:complete